MGKTLILIHGRSWKPNEKDLKGLWLEALEWGFRRDFEGTSIYKKWKECRKQFIYYGDISNEELKRQGESRSLSKSEDLKDRHRSLADLKKWKAIDFNKRNYKKLPGSGPFKEAVADSIAPLLRFIRLSDELIEGVAPDMHEYWLAEESSFGSDVRETLIRPLELAMDRNDSICVLSHSLGTMISYDTFWKFSYLSEYRLRGYDKKKIDLFISTGSPLADDTIKEKLKGARAKGNRRYPANLKRWVNVAAEDDFVAHDEKVAGDYQHMTRKKMIQSIEDIHIYNLALRKQKAKGGLQSHQHHGAGYLIHPKTIETIASWL